MLNLPGPVRAGALVAPVLASVAVFVSGVPVTPRRANAPLYVTAVDAQARGRDARAGRRDGPRGRRGARGAARHAGHRAAADGGARRQDARPSPGRSVDTARHSRPSSAFTAPTRRCLITFGDRPTVLPRNTTSPTALVKGVGRVFPGPRPASYLLDAIVDDARGLQKRDAPRPVIVVVGRRRRVQRPGYERVLDRVKAAGARCTCCSVDQGGSRRRRRAPTRIVARHRRRSRHEPETGGRRDILLSSMGLQDAAPEARRRAACISSRSSTRRPTSLIPPEKVDGGLGRATAAPSAECSARQGHGVATPTTRP